MVEEHTQALSDLVTAMPPLPHQSMYQMTLPTAVDAPGTTLRPATNATRGIIRPVVNDDAPEIWAMTMRTSTATSVDMTTPMSTHTPVRLIPVARQSTPCLVARIGIL
jgi:hypothetical protein